MKALYLSVSLLFTNALLAQQPGTLDKSFGENGFVRTSAYSHPFVSDGKASALQSDEKIIVGGNYFDPEVIRYLPDGRIDSCFGQDGIAGFISYASVTGIVIQPDGKIVISGLDYNKPLASVFAARFTSNGMIDYSFGMDGVINLDYNDYAGVSAIALQTDGKLVLAGGAGKGAQDVIYSYSTVMRLTANGHIDSTFGDDGRIENLTSSNNVGLAIQPDGKIVTAGVYYFNLQLGYDYVVSRYNEDGALNSSFGKNGNTKTDGFGYEDEPESILLQPDGKILLSGYSVTKQYSIVITALRYNTGGTLDSTFGSEGKVTVQFGENASAAYKALLQTDGKIVLAGGTYSDNAFNGGNFALCRIKSDGSIDSSFGTAGRQITVLETLDYAHSALLQKDGKIILVGESRSEDGYTDDFLLIRYNGDSQQSPLIAKIKHFLHNHSIGWQGIKANISYYSILYSKDGKDFTEKRKVNSAGAHSFQQYDFLVNETGYYRIVAVDKEGHKTFSNKVAVTNDDIVSTASVYPNPAKDYVTIKGLPAIATIIITDIFSKTVAVYNTNNAAQYRCDVSKLTAGVYYVQVTTAGKTETLRFIKE